ncbi:hypothetical protein CDIK_3622 [Cucumispora dikerogammari]|nr:hypothetical protein CDIK_3622 [Cucumispora dikerogammari]
MEFSLRNLKDIPYDYMISFALETLCLGFINTIAEHIEENIELSKRIQLQNNPNDQLILLDVFQTENIEQIIKKFTGEREVEHMNITTHDKHLFVEYKSFCAISKRVHKSNKQFMLLYATRWRLGVPMHIVLGTRG